MALSWDIMGPTIAGLLLVAPCGFAGEAGRGLTGDARGADDAAVVPRDPPIARVPGAAEGLYRQLCAMCHGSEGRGDGPSAGTMAVKPRDHTDPVYMGGLTDRQIFDTISRGGAAVGKFIGMPTWGEALTEQQIRDLVGYIRILQRPGR